MIRSEQENNSHKPLVVAGFPGTGKSSYCYRDVDYIPSGFAIDSDSSKFCKSNFPSNYIDHIKEKNITRIFKNFCK